MKRGRETALFYSMQDSIEELCLYDVSPFFVITLLNVSDTRRCRAYLRVAQYLVVDIGTIVQ